MPRTITRALLALAVLTGSLHSLNAALFVNVYSRAENPDGSSWAQAYPNLQQALRAARSGRDKTIWLASGTYTPTPNTDRSASFVLFEGLEIYGGFTGGELSLDQRDPEKNESILSGNIGSPDSDRDNSYHVITAASGAVLDGLVIEGGRADGDLRDSKGGGIIGYVSQSHTQQQARTGFLSGSGQSPDIRYCTLRKNYALEGGAMYWFDGAEPKITSCLFENNQAQKGGAAVFRVGSNAIVEASRFNSNQSLWRGGAVFIDYGANPRFANCTFRSNESEGHGGGVYVDDTSSQLGYTSPAFQQCLFFANRAKGDGGGMMAFNKSTPSLQDCRFDSNHASLNGGALAVADGTTVYTVKVELTKNTSDSGEARIYVDNRSRIVEGLPPKYEETDSQQGFQGQGRGNRPPHQGGAFPGGPPPRSGDGMRGPPPRHPMQQQYPIPLPRLSLRAFLSPVVRLAQWGPPSGPSGPGGGYGPPQQRPGGSGSFQGRGMPQHSQQGQGQHGPMNFQSVKPLTPDDFKDAAVLRVNHAQRSIQPDGTSWKTAFPTLHSALAVARNSQIPIQIWVAGGTYTPSDSGDRSAAFVLSENVALFGGFVGTEYTRSERNWEVNLTYLSGNIGSPGSDRDNSYHIIKGANRTVIDGFIIEEGNSAGLRPQDQQGGRGGPGGMSMSGRDQGGPHSQHTTPEAIMSSGTDSPFGSGMINFQASPYVANCIFRKNQSSKGSAMYNVGGASPMVISCRFEQNGNTRFNHRGGAIANDLRSDPTIIACSFFYNSTSAKGGAIYNDFRCSPYIENCLFVGNQATRGGAMASDGGSSPPVTNCTFTQNFATDLGGALYNGTYRPGGKGCQPVVVNSIFWNNACRFGPADIAFWHESMARVSHSILQQPGFPGQFLIRRSPLFTAPNESDFTPGKESPAIDQAVGKEAPSMDMNGNPRYDDPAVANSPLAGSPPADLGAIEARPKNTLWEP